MSVDNHPAQPGHDPGGTAEAKVVQLKLVWSQAPSLEARSRNRGGPRIPHPVVFGADRHPVCGHHLAAFCIGCSTCTECIGSCECGPDETEPPTARLDLAS
ncbi:hypothetical protein IU443_17775 [Nocardia farcinica]|uniref:hypothetical protein n=1 Tax=Nocardia farcinica TaxID=37329 RepID=UPI001895A729|nr:hypothetical protein [Nocardia farcinica]MBF6250726.1 hypothetical protein [Nocardia farcinica]MBF6261869.1 hypothetical protein [Nocardia farcinica]MBF6266860.1 hypothetical protein [Nocardia farcinica]MBF6280409.1 hypothetical protein [Nocardia farcinica]MBF6291740.1 hypothetical protein [Nocardia farcinica]